MRIWRRTIVEIQMENQADHGVTPCLSEKDGAIVRYQCVQVSDTTIILIIIMMTMIVIAMMMIVIMVMVMIALLLFVMDHDGDYY